MRNQVPRLVSNQLIAVGVIIAMFVIDVFPTPRGHAATAPEPSTGKARAEVYAAWPFETTEAVRRQDETANAMGVAKNVKVDLGGGVAIDFVLIPAGKYTMGDSPGRDMTVEKPFYLGKFLVTQAQYAKILGKNPSKHQRPKNPADSVDWAAATEFAAMASEKTKKTIRLPTEAEWEWACRAGTSTRCYWGDNMAKIGAYCVWHDNCGGSPNPVGTKLPNSWGLFDMMGNTWEWASDGGPEAKTHPCRGATFGSKLPMFKSSVRLMIGEGVNDRFGFRAAMEIP